MDVFISVDMEGITGLVAWSQCGRPSSEHYDFQFARRMMTHDANAAIRGARAAGAKRILVKDSHGTSRNLLIDELEPGVELISGMMPHFNGMMTGLDSTFGCAMLVGYHGMAGTQGGVMEHTITGGVHRMWINGKLCGEIGLSTATAGSIGVPLVMVSSDDKGCAEAADLVPGVKTAVVKYGIGRYAGRMLHPSETRPLIESAARDAVQSAGSISPWSPSLPVTIRIEFNATDQADSAALLPSWTRLDGYTIEITSDSWERAHREARMAMEMATQGPKANQ